MNQILIVEDEKYISDLIAMNMEMIGYKYIQVYDGKSAEELVGKRTIDLVLLDIMIPEKSGYDILPAFIKAKIPVIFLTAKNEKTDIVKGLRAGADDYITKPFDQIELLARIDAVLRRCGKLNKEVEIEDVRISYDCRKVYRQGTEVEFTSKEYQLLETLVQNQNIALSREKLLEIVWGYDYVGDTRTVDVHIQRIRKKLGWEQRISTVYKYGYRVEI
ncbi:MAG: response regulator transcription factor [Lachnospiraceae bacterium]|nr:response regulator transcription factor [Lachnospiraceae bacterium]MDD3615968.1 response regulator transcription factor [Lachnospiraceae bacterium]